MTEVFPGGFLSTITFFLLFGASTAYLSPIITAYLSPIIAAHAASPGSVLSFPLSLLGTALPS